MTYSEHWKSLRCYAARWNYTFVVEPGEQSSYSRCSHLTSYYFRKHCLVVEMWEQYPAVNWWLVLDGDTFVVSADRPLNDFLPSMESGMDLLLYERFPTGEVMAGNYLVRPTLASCQFLLSWADMDEGWSPHWHYAYDNGALHLHLIRTLWGADSFQWRSCAPLLSNVRSMDDYDSFVGCFKCMLGRQRLLPVQRLQIVRRGHFLVRDYDVSSPTTKDAPGLVGPGDLLFHFWKHSPVGIWWRYPIDSVACLNQPRWTPQLLHDVVASGTERVADSMRKMEALFAVQRPKSVVKDVGMCWPRCAMTPSVEEESEMRHQLCSTEALMHLASEQPKPQLHYT